MSRRAATMLAVLLSFGGACAGTPPPVDLSGTWPAQAGDYDDVTEAWTRRAILRGHFQQTLELIATFRSPPWLAAAAARAATVRGGSVAAAQETARTAEAGPYEIALVVTTYDRAENNLDRGERSIWRVALVDDRGTETLATEIVRDKRPPEVIRAELPEFGDFANAYVARFPRSAAVLGPGVASVTLRMWSSRGAVHVVWKAR